MTDYHALLAPLLRRRWIVVTEALAASTSTVRRLREIGAPRPFVIAGFVGTGELSAGEDAEIAVLGVDAPTFLGQVRVVHAALDALPASVIERIEAWDPRREARVLTSFLDVERRIAGRATWGARPASYLELEDKLTVDGVFEAAGIATAPSLVVAAEPAALRRAAAALDAGAGTVWSGDNREGWHGGAEYVRHVSDGTRADDVTAFFAGHCDRVRVMPLLEGLPCSIHAFVLPEAVLAFRPVELLVFRGSGGRFLYAGVTTAWDPSRRDREALRSMARRLGEHLRATRGYRGALSIDGVLGPEGFRPTEINPRFAVGLATQAGCADVPMLDLHRAALAGERLDLDPAALEQRVVEAADRERRLRAYRPTSLAVDETRSMGVRPDGDEVVAARGDVEAHGTLSLGPGGAGGIVMLEWRPEHVTAGPSAAPLVASAFALADRTWGTGIGAAAW